MNFAAPVRSLPSPGSRRWTGSVLGRVGLAGLVVALLLQLGARSVLVTQAPVPGGALLATPGEQAAPRRQAGCVGPQFMDPSGLSWQKS